MNAEQRNYLVKLLSTKLIYHFHNPYQLSYYTIHNLCFNECIGTINPFPEMPFENLMNYFNQTLSEFHKLCELFNSPRYKKYSNHYQIYQELKNKDMDNYQKIIEFNRLALNNHLAIIPEISFCDDFENDDDILILYAEWVEFYKWVLSAKIK